MHFLCFYERFEQNFQCFVFKDFPKQFKEKAPAVQEKIGGKIVSN